MAYDAGMEEGATRPIDPADLVEFLRRLPEGTRVKWKGRDLSGELCRCCHAAVGFESHFTLDGETWLDWLCLGCEPTLKEVLECLTKRTSCS